jgi:putative transposase
VETHECIVVHGRAEGVHHQAVGGRDAGRGSLQENRDQFGDILQLEQAVRRSGVPYECQRELEQENARLKKIVVGLSLDNEMLPGRHQAKASKPAKKRTVADEMRADWQVSIRRACAVIRFDPRTCRYTSRRPGQAPLKQRIREICQTRVRFGYRHVHVLLRRRGWEINAKKNYQSLKELGMQSRIKTPKRRVKAKSTNAASSSPET